MSYGGRSPENSQIIVKNRRSSFESSPSYFVGTGCYDVAPEREDPGAVEISQDQIDIITPIEGRSSFESKFPKIEESIYRAKKHLLKTRGGWV